MGSRAKIDAPPSARALAPVDRAIKTRALPSKPGPARPRTVRSSIALVSSQLASDHDV
jgi:hypothetical protein